MAKIRLGGRVEYTSGDGFPKLAFVTGTRETVKDGTDVTRPAADEAHLFVISPTGTTYHRESVKLGDGPKTFRRIPRAS